jgi:hypothetical protein
MSDLKRLKIKKGVPPSKTKTRILLRNLLELEGHPIL